MTTLIKLPPHLTTETGRADAATAIERFTLDEYLLDPIAVVPVPHLGYLSIQVLNEFALANWAKALESHHDAHPGDIKAHGQVADEVWGFIGGHHVNIWFCGAVLGFTPESAA